MELLNKALSRTSQGSAGAPATGNIDKEFAKGKTVDQIAQSTGHSVGQVKRHLRS